MHINFTTSSVRGSLSDSSLAVPNDTNERLPSIVFTASTWQECARYPTLTLLECFNWLAECVAAMTNPTLADAHVATASAGRTRTF